MTKHAKQRQPMIAAIPVAIRIQVSIEENTAMIAFKQAHFPRRWTALAVLPLMLAGSGIAQAQQPWTSVGSTGVVDEQDLSLFDFVNAEARVVSTAPAPSTLNLRYNVVALEELNSGFNTPYRFKARLRDNGAGSQVVLRLRSASFATGLATTIATIDSNALPPSPSYRNQEVCVLLDFDFVNNAYFIDADLIKSSTAGTPALSLIQIDEANCAG
ncbi:hypothetical protein [uncultured Lamprocystis sp.]|uniref:hypothetical protein n=2 Tax=uncultured Lamprocystis sp. TaxID=543132 RepID=UPI0025FAAABD|nr:hypothetical protein [uncultured Lamprocystis sp.]